MLPSVLHSCSWIHQYPSNSLSSLSRSLSDLHPSVTRVFSRASSSLSLSWSHILLSHHTVKKSGVYFTDPVLFPHAATAFPQTTDRPPLPSRYRPTGCTRYGGIPPPPRCRLVRLV